MDQRLSLITLGVESLAAARAFYEQGLGWRPLNAQPDIVFYQLAPGLGLALFPRDDLALNERSPAAVDAAYAQALAAGARGVKAPQAAVWGGYSGYFADPDGHLWELAHNPFCEITPRGETLFSAPTN
jgi:catechol 2,3-dioxygenase-like lactoylglutathione lyase family enzyme